MREEDRPKSTARFQRKRELILDAASALINDKGARGMTLAAVAEAVGLNTASVTYYFKRRDDLAAACYARTLDGIEEMVAQAAAEPGPRARVRRYLELNFDLLARIRRGEDRPITVLSDLRAMDDPVRNALADRYRTIMRQVRGFFGPDGDAHHKALLVARTHVLLENVYWLPVWLPRYSTRDFPRVGARLFELFEHGFAPDDARWSPAILDVDGDDGSEPAQRSFLLAATRLINERGYRGASVERIASELKVTKGSFYHHLQAKDDLVLACFRRSFTTVAEAQHGADEAGGDQWARLSTAIATLLDIQFSERGPLLRTSALQALPADFRAAVIDRSNRIARRFAGTMIDGISEGSIRAIDPLVASQALMAMLNSAYELRNWAAAASDPADPIGAYASTIAFGLFRDPPI